MGAVICFFCFFVFFLKTIISFSLIIIHFYTLPILTYLLCFLSSLLRFTLGIYSERGGQVGGRDAFVFDTWFILVSDLR